MKVPKECWACADRIIWISVGTTTFLAATKAFIGVWSGSMALVADAIHSAADVLNSVVTLIAVYVGKQPPDRRHPYGHGKSEFIAGALIGTVLLFGSAYILVSAATRLFGTTRYPAPHFVAMLAAAISIAVNEAMYRYGSCAAAEVNSSAIEAEAWDNRSDAISSMPVFFGVLGAQLGLTWLDPLVAVFIGFIVGKVGYGLLNKNLKGLMDGAIGTEDLDIVRQTAMAVPGVKGITYLRTRGMGRRAMVELQVLVNADTRIEKSDRITAEIRSALRRKMAYVGMVTVTFKSHKAREKEL